MEALIISHLRRIDFFYCVKSSGPGFDRDFFVSLHYQNLLSMAYLCFHEERKQFTQGGTFCAGCKSHDSDYQVHSIHNFRQFGNACRSYPFAC